MNKMIASIILFSLAVSATFTHDMFAQRIGETNSKRIPGPRVSVGNTERDSGTFAYEPDPGWVLDSYDIHRISERGQTSISPRYVQPKSRIASAQEVESHYNELLNAAGKKGLQELTGKIQYSRDEHLRQLRAASSNNRALVIDWSCKGRGIGQGGGGLSFDVTVHRRYIGSLADLPKLTASFRDQIKAGGGSSGTPSTKRPDPSLNPKYGDVRLKFGFTPDPFIRKGLEAGGSIHTNLGGVKAWVATRPDWRLNYTAGNAPLKIYVRSSADTTLLINTPDGVWVANDDGGGNRDPLIRFAKPRSGQYDIWIGTFGPEPAPATLYISER